MRSVSPDKATLFSGLSFWAILAIGLMAVAVFAFTYLYWPSTTPVLPGESFRVPPNTTAYLAWTNHLTGEESAVPIPAQPGQSIRLLVEGPERAVRDLDAYYATLMHSDDTASPSPEKAWEDLRQRYGISLLADHTRSAEQGRFQFHYMKSASPLMKLLRQRERLDDVVSEARTEFEKFCALTAWVRRQCPQGTPNPYPPWNALEILDQTRNGVTQAFCGQYAQVLVQCLISLGFQARYVGLTNHEVCEAWSNEWAKWVILDPFNCCYYRGGSQPLSALDIHGLVCESKFDAIEMVRLASGIAGDPHEQLEQYRMFNISMVNDQPEKGRSGIADLELMWQDRVYWVDPCSGRPDSSDGRLRMLTAFPTDVYFNLNTVEPFVEPIDKGVVEVRLETFTPELARIERSINGGGWEETPDVFPWRLERGRNVLKLRAVNVQGVVGPESELQLHYDS